jgi:CRISP-associated protein Cas1
VRHIQNTLYVSQDGAYLHKDGGSIIVRHEKQKIGQFPLIAIGEIVCFGFGIGVSPALAEYCSTEGITISYLSGTGRFLARLEGPVKGNVLLRRRQYRDSDSPARSTEIARCCVAAKITNQRNVLFRFLRNHADTPARESIERALAAMANAHRGLASVAETDQIRGIEGEASAHYFSVFDAMIVVQDDAMRFKGRTRRPPLDRVNALLSFAYSLLALDLRSALESVGLDPYVGFLHVERPGRPSLALDILEEFRAPFADRLVLSLVNLGQVAGSGFSIGPAGEVEMEASTRKAFLAAYQKRKRDTVQHPFLEEEMEVGVAFLAQARLLARHIRGDLDLYPAFIWR